MTTRQSETGFSVAIDDDGEVAVIRLAGELDSFTAPALRAGIAGVLARPGTIVDIRESPAEARRVVRDAPVPRELVAVSSTPS